MSEIINKKEYTILIAEDDKDIVELLRLYLSNEGYNVRVAEDGYEAYQIFQSEKIDLCIFDIMMPKIDGYELIGKVRETSNLPIICLSAKKADSEKILGLNLGADDYIGKPFNPLEVVARVQSALRRFYKLGATSEPKDDSIESYVVRDLLLDRRRKELLKSNVKIEVTPTEYKILELLMKEPGRVYTKIQISEWLNDDYISSDENSIRVHVSNLRDKIEDNSKSPVYLKTIHGLGYKMER